MGTTADPVKKVRLTIGLEGDDIGAAEIEEATQLLRRQLLRLDVEGVERPRSGALPKDAKSGEIAQIGELVVTLAHAAPALAALAGVLNRWLRGRSGRRLHIEMEGDVLDLSNASPEEQQAALGAWLGRHRGESRG